MATRLRPLTALLLASLLGALLAPFVPLAAAAHEDPADDLRFETRGVPEGFAGSSTTAYVNLYNEGAVAHEVLAAAWADGFQVSVSPSRALIAPGWGVVLEVRILIPERTPGGSYVLTLAAQGRHADPAEAEASVPFGVYGTQPCCEPRPEPRPQPEPCCPRPEPCCEPQPPSPCCEPEPCCAPPPAPPCCPEPQPCCTHEPSRPEPSQPQPYEPRPYEPARPTPAPWMRPAPAPAPLELHADADAGAHAAPLRVEGQGDLHVRAWFWPFGLLRLLGRA